MARRFHAGPGRTVSAAIGLGAAHMVSGDGAIFPSGKNCASGSSLLRASGVFAPRSAPRPRRAAPRPIAVRLRLGARAEFDDPGSDHRVPAHQGGAFGLAPRLGAVGALGQDEVAHVGRAVVDADGTSRDADSPNSASTARGSRTARER